MVRAALLVLMLPLTSCALFRGGSALNKTGGFIPKGGHYVETAEKDIQYKVLGVSHPTWKDWRFKKQSALGRAYDQISSEKSIWVRLGIEVADSIQLPFDRIEWEHLCDKVLRSATIVSEFRDPDTSHYSVEMAAMPLRAIVERAPMNVQGKWSDWKEIMIQKFRSKIFRQQ